MSASAEWYTPGRPSLSGETQRLRPATAEMAAVIHLRGVARRISRALPLEKVLLELIEFAASMVACDSCFVYVLEGDELVLRASKNPHGEAMGRLKLRLGQGITGWVAEHREPAIVPQKAYADPRFKLFNELPEDHFEAFLSVPMVSRGRLVGVLNLQNQAPHHYDDCEIGLISTIGFLVGAEIEMARLEGENSQLAERLAMRKLVERAKGILQSELRISEPEAYLMLQRQSQQRRRPMKEIAEAIVLSYAIKHGAEAAS
jgi:uroporphyrinogen-III synthase